MLKHNKRMFAAVGTSSVVVSSGLLAWQMYNVKQTQSEINDLKEKLSIQQQKNQLNELSNEREGQSQYIKIPRRRLDSDRSTPSSLDQFDDFRPRSFTEPFEHTEGLKDILPRHLRKPFRLLNEANNGDYEQHLNAVRELSRLELTDGEYNQIAQSCDYRTAVGLARTNNVDLRFFLKPAPLPPGSEGKEMIRLMRDILASLPGAANSKELHQCIQLFTATALDQYLANAEEEVMDSDLSYEFHRESHHIHSIPRPRICQVTRRKVLRW